MDTWLKDFKPQHPAFFLSQDCHVCGFGANPMVYKPDLLNGPVTRSCQRNGWCGECSAKWDVALDSDGIRKLTNLIRVAWLLEQAQVAADQYKQQLDDVRNADVEHLWKIRNEAPSATEPSKKDGGIDWAIDSTTTEEGAL